MESKIYLRALNIDDHLVTYEWRKDPIYKKGVISRKKFVDINTEKKWMEKIIQNHEKGKEVRLAIIEKKSDNLVGLINLSNLDYINRNVHVGIMLGPKYRAKGYAFEASLQILDYAFKELGMERASYRVLEDNRSSIYLCKKVGSVEEGVLRKAVFKNGVFKNLLVFSMLKDEFYSKYDFLRP